MRYLTIDKLEKGMAIGQDIFGGTGEVRYKNHEILDEITIRELEAMGYQGLGGADGCLFGPAGL